MSDMSLLGVYPEREEVRPGKLDKIGLALSGKVPLWSRPSPSRFQWIAARVHEEEEQFAHLRDAAIVPVGSELGARMRSEGFTEELAGRKFDLIRELAGRTVGMRHFDVQLVGGIVLLKGMIAEMETGEGKTLTATLAAGAAALAGMHVHIVTVNDYLASRDAELMGPVYRALGLTVGTIQQGMSPGERRAMYGCNITYCTNKELTFDYLKDRIVLWDRPRQVRLQLEQMYGGESRINKVLLRGLQYAIVDEVDSVLIDEARTPLIISGEADGSTEHDVYREAFNAASELLPEKHFRVDVKHHLVELNGAGKAHIESFAWTKARGWTTARQRDELVRQALVALNLFHRDKQYLVHEGKVQIIDEYTGRTMPDRSWEQGLHQLIEIKENCEMTSRKETRARMSYQRFFRRYLRLAGMTGTANEVAGELWTTYGLPVVTIPTNRPRQRAYLPQKICSSEAEKWQSVFEEISEMHAVGRPVLVGTRSVEASEKVSALLEEAGLPHRVLNARQDKEEANIVAEAGTRGCITVATNMAGRGTDIKLQNGVRELGGLHVIATERHDSGRIDRQLFGRCARQGDPGSCRAIVSLDDELITNHGGKTLPHFTAAMLLKPESRLARWAGTMLFFNAQAAAERLHRRMRRALLNTDEKLTDSLAFSGRPE
jgi:preprotein translocase subunit SecA